jgi:arylsulfatase B
MFTDEAVRIIQTHDASPVGPPLFLYVAHLAVHAGNRGKFLEAPQSEIEKFRHITDPNRRTYAGNENTSILKKGHRGCEGNVIT